MRPLPILLGLGLLILGSQNCKSVDLGVPSDSQGKDTTTYSCTGKTLCSQMKTCNEAKYYLENCPNVEMDGDLDGIPCEEQFCGH